MFSTNVMNEQTENNRQTNCFLKSFSRKPSSDISFSLSNLQRYDKKQRTKRPSQRQGVKMLPSLRLQGNLLWSTEVEYLKATKTETCGQLALHLPTLKQKKSWRSSKHKVTFPSPFLLVYSNFNEMHHPLIGLVPSWRRLPLLHVCIFVITNPRVSQQCLQTTHIHLFVPLSAIDMQPRSQASLNPGNEVDIYVSCFLDIPLLKPFFEGLSCDTKSIPTFQLSKQTPLNGVQAWLDNCRQITVLCQPKLGAGAFAWRSAWKDY